ncbi:hypothetical protein JHD46_05155 [Sulfurimonas sp. SAG-AH-194-C20]|nr:hypothetical protein [Sulfurimonas sp. SAG-AH-194-C20]MDF1879026.1 hypothetical protein [Sulfurimonas sp. SAG-AH-194-C20]
MKLATRTLTLKLDNERLRHIDRVWELLEDGYKDVKGGLFFTSKENLLKTTAQWKVIVCANKIIAVTIYKAKKGLKLVAMTVSKAVEYKKTAVNALTKLIKRDLKTCWMELSEAAEKFVMRFAKDYAVKNHLVAQIINKDITLSADGVHYFRTIKNINKEKILLGTPVFN